MWLAVADDRTIDHAVAIEEYRDRALPVIGASSTGLPFGLVGFQLWMRNQKVPDDGLKRLRMRGNGLRH